MPLECDMPIRLSSYGGSRNSERERAKKSARVSEGFGSNRRGPIPVPICDAALSCDQEQFFKGSIGAEAERLRIP